MVNVDKKFSILKTLVEINILISPCMKFQGILLDHEVENFKNQAKFIENHIAIFYVTEMV